MAIISARTACALTCEEELRALKEFYETVVNSITDSIAVIQPGTRRILGVNQALLRELGYRREEEVLGRPCHEVIHNSPRPCRPPNCPCPLEATLGTGEPAVCEHRHPGQGDEENYIAITTYPIRSHKGKITGVVHISRDITARKKAELELRSMVNYQVAVLSSLEEAIFTLGPSGRIMSCNLAAERIFGYKHEELIGQPLSGLRPDEAGARKLNRLVAAVKRSGQPQVALHAAIQFRRKSQAPLTTDCTLSPLVHEQEGVIGFVCAVRDVTRIQQLELDARYLREELRAVCETGSPLGISPAFRQVMEQARLVAPTDTTVLLQGETGTGKELVARMIHCASKRSSRPLVTVNCAALAPGLIESELFGHEKGSFTGATGRKLGRFELAHQGTIFLDEVGEIPPETQVKLLRVLEAQEFERVGSTRTLKVDVRLIAATNRNLTEEVTRGRFRTDLYYRLNVFPIQLPRLRERPEDIPILARYFAGRHAKALGKAVTDLSPESVARLQGYPWPGNVRELENIMERAVILSAGGRLDVPQKLLGAAPAGAQSKGLSLRETEREHILKVLEQTGWQIEGPSGAARLLGLAPSTLRSKLKRLRIARGQTPAA
jgi:formate hydrogenlyase transcriptional activator